MTSNNNPFKPGSKAYVFYNLANVDSDGFSDTIGIDILKQNGLATTNGGDWCRTDGTLGKTFNIFRTLVGGKISSVQLRGYTKNTFERAMDKQMRNKYRGKPCVILAIGGGHIEIDHKDGRYDKYGTLSDDACDYQPLHKCANDAKRTHCKRCREYGIKFDARLLGYSSPVYKGGEEYSGSCIGCYWYDPVEFNKQISSSFQLVK